MFAKKNGPSISSLDMHSNLGDDEMYLRKRNIRDIRDSSPVDRLDDDDDDDMDLALSEEEEDIPGCPLPSTPEDNDLLEAEVRKKLKLERINVVKS